MWTRALKPLRSNPSPSFRGSFIAPEQRGHGRGRGQGGEGKYNPGAYNGYVKTLQRFGLSPPEVHTPKSRYEETTRSINDYIGSIELRKNPTQRDKNLWPVVKTLKHIRPQKGDKLALELLVDLFDVAKVQPQRYKRVRLVGDVIYSYGARLDAINESDYIDSLFTLGHKRRALDLWRTNPDAQDWLYWKEIGASMYLRWYDAANAEKVAEDMFQQFEYVPPKLMVEFVRMYSEKQDEEGMTRWYQTFMANVQQQGFEKEGEKHRNLSFEQAAQVANERHLPTVNQLHEILDIMLYRHYWKLATTMVADMHELELEVPVERIMALINRATRQYVKPKQLYVRRAVKHSEEFVPLLSTLISTNPQVLNSTEIYQSWLRGLTGMGLYSSARQVIDAMLARGIEVDLDVCIKSLLARHNVAQAKDLLGEMDTGGRLPSPTNETFALFIRHATTTGDEQLLQEMLGRAPQLSDGALQSLLHYYCHHDGARFTQLIEKLTKEQHLSHSVYRTSWQMLRKYYQRHGPASTIMRGFMQSMLQDPNFNQSSAHVYETAVQAMLLAHDVSGAAGVLDYMTRQGHPPQGLMALGIMQLCAKIKAGNRAMFMKSGEVQLPKEGGDPEVPWQNVVGQMCTLLEVDTAEVLREAENMFHR